MKILFLTKYSPLGSSSRYRVYQFLSHYEAAGIECSVINLHTDAYVRRFGGVRDWRPKARRIPYLLLRYSRRLLDLLRAGAHDLVVVEQEVFPLCPPSMDSVVFRSAKPVVVEYDDATHVYHQQLLDSALLRRLLRRKVQTLMTRSDGVIAGNRHLADYARQYNSNVLVAPTAIDPRRYGDGKRPDTFSAPGSAHIGWIGTPLTASYLRGISGVLQTLAKDYDVLVKVIGDPLFKLEGVNVSASPWGLETEVEELQSCDIGVMPLTDDAYSRGKCGAKLLQYMAAGIPPVASAVGANREIIQQGENGFLAETPADWIDKLQQLILDVELRRKLGDAARATVEREYSVSAVAPKLVGFFRQFK